MDDYPNKLEGKLVESIKIDGLGDLAQEYAELGLDLITDDGVLRDIPIVGSIVKISKAVGSIRDRLYLKKLLHFLHKVGETTQQEREAFIEDNCQETKQFEETVLLILERSDRIEKATLIGKIFKACILGKLRYADALKLSEMTNRAFWGDMVAMLELKDSKQHNHQHLFTAGLFSIDESPMMCDTAGKVKYRRNDYAFVLQEIYREDYENLDKCLLGILAKEK